MSMPAAIFSISIASCVVRAGARRGVVQLARLRLHQRDEILERIRLDAGMHHQQVGRGCDQRHRHEILDRVVLDAGVRRRRDHVGAGGAHGERVAVGRGAGRDLGADRAAGAAAVVDDHLLAEALGELLPDQARDDVGRAARRERDDQADRLGRIGALRNGSGGQAWRAERPQAEYALVTSCLPPLLCYGPPVATVRDRQHWQERFYWNRASRSEPGYSTCIAPALMSSVRRAAWDLMKASNFSAVPPSISRPS